MNRRQFLTSLAAVVAAPAVAKMPEGWLWEGDTLIIRDQEIYLDKPIDLRSYRNVIIERCKMFIGFEGGMIEVDEDVKSVEIRDCVIEVRRGGWTVPH